MSVANISLTRYLSRVLYFHTKKKNKRKEETDGRAFRVVVRLTLHVTTTSMSASLYKTFEHPEKKTFPNK